MSRVKKKNKTKKTAEHKGNKSGFMRKLYETLNLTIFSNFNLVTRRKRKTRNGLLSVAFKEKNKFHKF